MMLYLYFPIMRNKAHMCFICTLGQMLKKINSCVQAKKLTITT